MNNNRSGLFSPWFIGPALLVFAHLLAGLLSQAAHGAEEDGREPFEKIEIHTAEYILDESLYRGRVFRWQYGGGISALDDGFLLGTREGIVYQFWWNDGEELIVRQLAHRVPLNKAAFSAGVGDAVNELWFRVADVLVVPEEGRIRLFATHHFWKEQEKCTTVRLSMLEGSRTEVLSAERPLAWRTVFEAVPCLPIAQGNRGHPFAGNHVGGRLALLDSGNLLVSIGDHGYDGWNTVPAMPQDANVSYGKIWRIGLADYEAEIFSLGHRNAQGLWVDRASGKVWSTEHGPQGGDELNLVVQGGNYGWPAVTYGNADGMRYWPMRRDPGEGESFRPPVYAWVPSIGVSNLVGVPQNSGLPDWTGDLLVSSLRDEAIWRVRLRDDQVAYAERIPVKTRVRDMAMGSDGRIVMWTDEGEIVSIQPQPKPRAAKR